MCSQHKAPYVVGFSGEPNSYDAALLDWFRRRCDAAHCGPSSVASSKAVNRDHDIVANAPFTLLNNLAHGRATIEHARAAGVTDNPSFQGAACRRPLSSSEVVVIEIPRIE